MQSSLFPKGHTRASYNNTFRKAYSGLNEEQKQAVDLIEGPVMVIAGPGTGKTQILSVRVGKILLETDVQAHNILCLTYTDAATLSMRNRLLQIIGPDAHKVHIHTFHSFCNQVIQENLGYFGNFRQLEPLSDLEKVDVYQRLMRDLPDDHRLKRLKGNPDYEIGRMKQLFSLMKKENYTAAYIDQVIDDHLTEMKTHPDMLYKRKTGDFLKGDLRPKKYGELINKMEDLRAGAQCLKKYKALLSDLGRYDYEDMILWVINAFEDDPDLLLQYQERYQYFLIDEYQDTNGSQYALLDHLISFWADRPNAFVVGDDDQAIYKFQGANLGNIKKYYKKYNPQIVVLKRNYRSAQTILNAAMGLIDLNAERIIKESDLKLDKNLESHAAHKALENNVSIRSYPNLAHEEAALIDQLSSLHKSGANLGKTAVIYRNHAQVERIVEVLEKKDIPLNIKRKVDVLKTPLVRNILNILTYINAQYYNNGYTDRGLFELLHYNFFQISAHDISKLIWETRNARTLDQEGQDHGKTPLATLIAEPSKLQKLKIKSVDSIVALHQNLDKWISEIGDVTIQVLFQNIINEGKILSTILNQSNKSWLLQVLNTLFNLIKKETTKNPDLSLQEFLDMIEKMKENKLKVEVNKVISTLDGVNFMTAHSSKGLEFENVHILGATKNKWDGKNKSRRTYTYPPALNGDSELNIEDERRLFYVAMTRAEQELSLNYSLHNDDDKLLGASQFVDELVSVSDIEVAPQEVSNEVLDDFQIHILRKHDKAVDLIDHDLIDRMLEGYQLSVTGLNKYLKCPLTFYFESVLRVPMARTKYLGFGRGVHHALEYYYRDCSEKKSVDQSLFLTYFQQGMNHHRAHFTTEEFRDMNVYGNKILTAYYDAHLQSLDPAVKSYELEVKIDRAEYNGVPIKGILDRVDVYGQQVIVTDYKTGNSTAPRTNSKLRPPTEKHSKGGDYWRQIVFYKMLLNSDKRYNWDMIEGIMDFVEPDRKTGDFKRKKYVVSEQQIEIVGEQITQTWLDIRDHKFDKGCGEDDCQWCNFISNDYIINPALIDGEEIDTDPEEYEER